MSVLTVITHEADGNARTIATTLALRRANAGRNVLLLQQQKALKQANQYSKEKQGEEWLATEMKDAARPHPLCFGELFNACHVSANTYHDIVIEMPKLQGADAKTIFSMTDTLVLAIPPATWNKDKCTRCIKQLNLARSCHQDMSVLMIVDEVKSLSAQAMINRFFEKVPGLRFIFIPPNSSLLLSNLYKAIFSKPVIDLECQEQAHEMPTGLPD
ncbi:hypothetical protein [Undibacterium sp. TJN19]|uniref:hypothetical protein n=1 Tax=Undibacterium sp. TJN19 TaxID=3413055 RepID=UPI003BF42CB8